ncbi:MAG: glycosyltransferase [Cyanobacteria bacterium J06631_2]
MSKIVLIHPQAGIDWKSNSAVFAVELARRLDNYFEVELLSGAECGSFSRPIHSLAYDDSSVNNSLAGNIAHRWFSTPKLALSQMTSFLPCITHLLNHPADLVLPQNGYSGLLAATYVRAIKQTPILFTEHHSLLNQVKLQRNLRLKPNRLIALNIPLAKYLSSLSPNQIIDTIPLGIDPIEFTPEGKAIATGLTKPCVVAVAGLNRQNNQRLELTIEAVARLPNASLLVCGEGVDRDYFQNLGDRLLGKQRFQIRSFAYAQMPLVYRSGNIFTSAAIQESCGLKYLEAMSCGLPVVASDHPVHRYLIGNGGITCDVSDLDSYAEVLHSTLEKHWYQGQPRQNALRFSWQGITLLYYQAILKTITTSENKLTSVSNGSIEQ